MGWIVLSGIVCGHTKEEKKTTPPLAACGSLNEACWGIKEDENLFRAAETQTF